MRIWLIRMLICSFWAFSSFAHADIYADVNALVKSGQWASARTLADTRLKTVPTDPQMRLLESHIQTGLGQTRAAMDTLRSLTQAYPELPEPHNNLAALLVKENRLDEAMTSLQAALKARPDYALALENLGDLHLTLAAQSYARAQAISPGQTRLQTKQLASEQALQTP